VSEVRESEGTGAPARATATCATPARAAAARLRVAIGAFTRRVQETAAEGELSSPQLIALSRLDRLGPMTTAELARREQITPQAMGATVASLEQGGLVVRSPDPADARRSILTLTPEGRTAIQSGRSALADRVAAALERSFTADEIAVLRAATPLIERLSDLL
jgi:DNA-binding MarR family transcriptional regulator